MSAPVPGTERLQQIAALYAKHNEQHGFPQPRPARSEMREGGGEDCQRRRSARRQSPEAAGTPPSAAGRTHGVPPRRAVRATQALIQG